MDYISPVLDVLVCSSDAVSFCWLRLVYGSSIDLRCLGSSSHSVESVLVWTINETQQVSFGVLATLSSTLLLDYCGEDTVHVDEQLQSIRISTNVNYVYHYVFF